MSKNADLDNSFRPENSKKGGVNKTRTLASGARVAAEKQTDLIPLDTRPPEDLTPAESDVWARMVARADWLAENQRDLISHLVRVMAGIKAKAASSAELRNKVQLAIGDTDDPALIKALQTAATEADRSVRADEKSILSIMEFLELKPDGARNLR